jgi:osmoprotectant transport system ATP-binding protein
VSDTAGPEVAWQAVTKRFAGQTRPAVDGVTLTVAAGSFVALVGGSGSGKSTLLKMVNRLVEPDFGAVRIGGVPADTTAPHLLRRRIGYVFQNVGLFPHMSVQENIALAGGLRGQVADVPELLGRVGLPADYATRWPRQLSGGEQQRVGVARALDPVTRDAIGTAYRALHDRLGLTTILVTHDMAEALLLADRILVMAAGRIVADAAPAALLAGGQGAEADALVAVPKRQIKRLAGLAAHG